jgi:hypothetical protein
VELEVSGRTLMVHSTSEKTLAVCSLPPRVIQSFVGYQLLPDTEMMGRCLPVLYA